VPVTHEGFIDRLCTDAQFRLWLAELLSGTEHPAFFFEMPPITTSNLQSRSEFVLLDAPSLARSAASSSAFAEHFDDGEDVVTRSLTGANANMVVRFSFRPVDPSTTEVTLRT